MNPICAGKESTFGGEAERDGHSITETPRTVTPGAQEESAKPDPAKAMIGVGCFFET